MTDKSDTAAELPDFLVLEASPDTVREAARVIRAGGLVAFPTETVYGLGADATNDRSMFDDRGSLAELGRLDRRALAGRARAHHQHVEIMIAARPVGPSRNALWRRIKHGAGVRSHKLRLQ